MTTGFRSSEFTAAAEQFGQPRGYLNVAAMGIPPRAAVEALTADLELFVRAERNPRDYDGIIARTRASYAQLVGVPVSEVAIGSQTSVQVSLAAAAVPPGAEVLLVHGDFSSVVFPFLQRSDITVRHVPVAALAGEIGDNTWLVAFSLVQSATGEVADTAAILEAAARVGARTLCDTTQAAGVLPVDANAFDMTVCHSYKWLCAPRGVCFLTVSEEFAALLTPIQAGWAAGEQVWSSTYGPEMTLAPDARRFDVSPAWPSWVGAEHSIALFAGLDIAQVWAHASGLGDALCEGLGIPAQHQAIVTWPDADGSDLERLTAAGVTASGRAGRLRASFHLWNDESDVAAVLRALGR